MSLTEVGRLAIGKNCFHCAVKDATSYGISIESKNASVISISTGSSRNVLVSNRLI